MATRLRGISSPDHTVRGKRSNAGIDECSDGWIDHFDVKNSNFYSNFRNYSDISSQFIIDPEKTFNILDLQGKFRT